MKNLDGVVCGHIHSAEQRRFGGIDYYNDGDWVESCTALVEHRDGRMEILHWADEVAARGTTFATQAYKSTISAVPATALSSSDR